MELAGGLLITAAVGAMLLTHSDRLGPKVTQLQTARNKMRAFGRGRSHRPAARPRRLRPVERGRRARHLG